jgi:chromosome partitioning protein
VVITDGQASSDEEELRHLAVGSDLVLLPTAPKARAVELSVELAQLLQLLQRVQVLHAVGLQVLGAESPLLPAFDKAETQELPVFSHRRPWPGCPPPYGRLVGLSVHCRWAGWFR